MSRDLPIFEILPALRQALLAHRNAVLQAPPGAGKSTVVPLELLGEPWMRGQRLIMLEPRRLATRAVAARMAQTLGESVGGTVGYRMRLESRVGPTTRIEVVTEGVLAAMLQHDAALEGVGAILFDEFHERSLQADLGLALCLDVQAALRPELRLLVMSATIAADAVAALLHDAPIVRSTGKLHPVEVHYLTSTARRPAARLGSEDTLAVAKLAASGAQRALNEQRGDALVFLPGAAEIRRVASLLDEQLNDSSVRVLPLMGELDFAAQDLALKPAAPGTRKIVLATNIAETSLTIEGIGSVVDSGLVRRSRFDPTSGMSRLETLPISRASAEQRCGRAGRLGPGLCLRLWTEGTQASLEAQTPAEILEADLASLALDLAAWNVVDPKTLRWLDPPPAAPYEQARELLASLDALDSAGRITPAGREMLVLRVHPRLAHMLLRSRDLGLQDEACDLAALLSERDVFARTDAEDADIRSRLEALRGESHGGARLDKAALERVRRVSGQLRQRLGERSRGARKKGARTADEVTASAGSAAAARVAAAEVSAVDVAGVLLAWAYPDRIARRRDEGQGRYVLSNGRGARFTTAQSLAKAEFLVVAALDDREREARIFMAAPLSRKALETALSEHFTVTERIDWNERERAVEAVVERRLGVLVVDSGPLTDADPTRVAQALIAGIRRLSLTVLPWDRETRAWQARLRFVRALPSQSGVAWPDVSDAALLAGLETWLAPWLDGLSRVDHLARLDLTAILGSMLGRDLQRRLEQLAPTHVQVPSGSRIRIDYEDEAPSLSVRLQEVFGLAVTPRIGGGTVPLVLKLLSPAQRPVQVTRDLASFWANGYAEVRKELKGRYPKHAWPEDPRTAPAMRGARRRKA
ncbi:MAG TPA: ATP-dependent helicase HrpB [Steroidobacteraceae bacterium]|nr:ATP-dependent helicase HrpB [Steroidobacteraceae bacterium]